MDPPMPAAIPEFVGDGRYRIVQKIGAGSYGAVYLAIDSTNQEEVAVKLEIPHDWENQLLCYEFKLYHIFQGGVGIPDIRYFRRKEEGYNVMVMDLLGPTLEDLFNICSRKFTMKTILMLAYQMIQRVEYIHIKGFVHRDIKPNNLLMGTKILSHIVYLIDYGLANRYRDSATREHVPYQEDGHPTGTMRFGSTNAHLGIEQSRRDDLESIGYVLMYFLRGNLPWESLKGATRKHTYEKVWTEKMSTPIELLFEGYPQEFATYLKYCRDLRFDEEPNYIYLRLLFLDLLKTFGHGNDYVFDWKLLKESKPSSQQPVNPVATAPGNTTNDGKTTTGQRSETTDANANV